MLVCDVVLRIGGFRFLVIRVFFRPLVCEILFILVVLAFVGRVYCGVGECSQTFFLCFVNHERLIGY